MTTCTNCGLHSDQAFRFCPQCGVQTVGPLAASTGLIGRTLNDKYRVVDKIGEGSMGTVYLAEHVSLKKKVAVKVLHQGLEVSEETLQRFQREGIAAGQIDHPNVIQIFDFDRSADGHFYLAMEFVAGTSLKVWLHERGPTEAVNAVRLTRQLLGTLAEAHAHGIVHRDLKPENLMVVEATTGELTLKVLDFGLSKLVDRPLDASLLTVPGRVMGTPLYMAPEQWRGEEVDHRSDLYAAALILYELLTGKQPFRGSSMTDTMIRSTTEPPPPLSASNPDLRLPSDLDGFLQRGLAKRREERFQSANDMLAALDDIRFERLARAGGRRRSAGRRARPKRRSNLRPNLAFGAAVAVVIAIASYFLIGSARGSDAAARTEVLLRSRADDERREPERAYLALLDEANERLRERDSASALAAVEKAIRMPCRDAEAYLVRAAIYRSRHDNDTALADLREALQLHPRYAAAAAAIGWIHFDSGALEQAEQRFASACEMDAASGEAWAGRAAVLCARGEPARAEELLAARIDDLAGSARAHLYLGEARLAQNDLDAAVQSFVQAKRQDSRLWRAYAGLGAAYLRKGDRDAAEQQWRAALEVGSDAVEARCDLAELLLAGARYDEAEQVLSPAVSADTEVGRVRVLTGLIERGRGNRRAAIAALEQALTLVVDEPGRVHALLAALLLEEQRFEPASDHCEQALVADASLEGALVTWGVARFRLGDYDGAADKLEQALALAPDDAFAHYTLGVLYRDYLLQPGKALEHFRAHRAHGGARPHVDGWIEQLAR